MTSPIGATPSVIVAGGPVANVSWSANLTQPMPIKLEFTGKVTGDKIGGSVKLGAFGNATWEGTRA